jgi:hypothetical protein
MASGQAPPLELGINSELKTTKLGIPKNTHQGSFYETDGPELQTQTNHTTPKNNDQNLSHATMRRPVSIVAVRFNGIWRDSRVGF